jgi:hypothetical protein
MLRIVIPLLFLLALLLGACSESNSSRQTEFRPCPSDNLRVACGRSPSGNYFRL